jgi:hypothetical protein
MESLVQPAHLRAHILLWAEEEIKLGTPPAKSGSILKAILYRGELPSGEADSIVGTGPRQARRIVSALVERGVLESENPRAPLHLTSTPLVSDQFGIRASVSSLTDPQQQQTSPQHTQNGVDQLRREISAGSVSVRAKSR